MLRDVTRTALPEAPVLSQHHRRRALRGGGPGRAIGARTRRGAGGQHRAGEAREPSGPPRTRWRLVHRGGHRDPGGATRVVDRAASTGARPLRCRRAIRAARRGPAGSMKIEVRRASTIGRAGTLPRFGAPATRDASVRQRPTSPRDDTQVGRPAGGPLLRRRHNTEGFARLERRRRQQDQVAPAALLLRGARRLHRRRPPHL